MTKAEAAALDYARTHMQAVRIVWMDREPEILSAEDAVVLCSNHFVSGRIIAAVAQGKQMEAMLNALIDAD